MRKRLEKIPSPKRGRDYALVAYDIDPHGEDKDFVDRIRNEASQHSANIQNPGGVKRNKIVLSKTRQLYGSSVL